MTINEHLGYAPGTVALRRAGATGARRRLRAWVAAAPKVALVLGDLVAVALAEGAALFLRVRFGGGFDVRAATVVAVLTTAMFPVLLSGYRLYSSRFITRGIEEMRRILLGVGAGVLTMGLLCVAFGFEASRAWLLTAGLLLAFTLLAERAVARTIFNKLRLRGAMLRPVVVVGTNAEAQALCSMFLEDRTLGYDVVGIVDASGDNAPRAIVDEVLATLDRSGGNGVVIAATALDMASSNRLIRRLTDCGVHVELSSSLRDIAPQRLTVRPLGRFPVVYVEPVIRHGWRARAKRGFDIVVAGGLLLVTLPVLVVAAIAIKLDSPGPVLFRQKRVGRNGELFEVLKLRTMVVDAEAQLDELRTLNEADGPLFKLASDPRITRVGRVLRRTSVDELPQLFNVLRNDMSMVGPRPALAHEVAGWSIDLHDRLRVQPGITGAWQVNGRSSSSFDDYERLDLYYVDNWSLLTDVAIVLRTVPAILLQRGAC